MRAVPGLLSFALIAACGGDDKVEVPDDTSVATPTGTPTPTTVDTGPCLGTLTGTIAVTGAVDCNAGCSGTLLLGWFEQNPTTNPTTEPLVGSILNDTDLSTRPFEYTMTDVPCGYGWFAALLDVDNDFLATPGDLVPMQGADPGEILEGQATTINQALSLRLSE